MKTFPLLTNSHFHVYPLTFTKDPISYFTGKIKVNLNSTNFTPFMPQEASLSLLLPIHFSVSPHFVLFFSPPLQWFFFLKTLIISVIPSPIYTFNNLFSMTFTVSTIRSFMFFSSCNLKAFLQALLQRYHIILLLLPPSREIILNSSSTSSPAHQPSISVVLLLLPPFNGNCFLSLSFSQNPGAS